MIARLTYLLISTALSAAVAILLLNGIAALERGAVAAAQDLVQVGAARVEVGLAEQSRRLAPSINDLVEDEELATDLRALTMAVNLVVPAGKLAERMKQRIDGLREQLLDRVGAWSEQIAGIDGIALTDETGMVMFATAGSRFKPGEKLDVPPEPDDEEPAPGAMVLDGGAETTAAAPKADPAGEFLLTAVRGGVQSSTVARGGEIRWVTATAILQRSRIVGALLLETRLQSLPATPGTQAFMIIDGLPVLGKAPEGLDAANVPASEKPILLLPKSPQALLFGSTELPLAPMFVDSDQIGVWGQRFQLRGLPRAFGVVVADTAPVYADLAGVQASVILFLGIAWLGHALIILLGGSRLRRGVEQIADFLGRVHLGTAAERQLSEKKLPRELVRLVRLLNTVIPGGDAAGVSPLPKAPSLDDVLEAQNVEELPPDLADLEFEGISDAAAIGLKERQSAPPDGFESLGEAATSAEQAIDAAEGDLVASDATELPELPEAMAALEQLNEEEPPSLLAEVEPEPEPEPAVLPQPPQGVVPPTPAEPRWQAEPAGRNVMGSGPAAQGVALSKAPPKPPVGKPRDDLGDLLDEYSTDATTVMQLSPELMAAVKEAAETDNAEVETESPAPVNEGLADAEAELAAIVGAPVAPPPPVEAPPSPPAETPEKDDRTVVDVRPPSPRTTHYQEVFRSFCEAREECGESVADLTFDKFAAKLDKTRDAVIAKHGCREVRFQVYIKDGKAGLKAVPAR